MASEQVQLETVKEFDFADSEQRLKEFDAEKTNTLPRIQVRGTAAKPPRHRMQHMHKPGAPRACDASLCLPADQFGVDKTNLPTDLAKFTRKRLEKLPRFRV
ncbi:hypothetical protein MPTK1_6g14720 [Marchantia polymorpha subsp. ruderalis]|uniref:Uncharacterized protein n=2 Tax=Marchantia polymorpha TaxID=3197 RepID=A0AAF6BS34_MARPO|nr:hypothetical protein MARPO_0047s0126 [Marchantia polymorpha]BBN14818.1 hypothetical protein Mp_6g14720 [Marchantia polymorpha subsp. ruderalis]|eukprot:PTQ39162.1 hypothetical protein MARPO_0047s0126 [Marchantia polymorpha]